MKVLLLSPQRKVFETEATEVVLPSEEGMFGARAGHAPMLARVACGRGFLVTAGGKKEFGGPSRAAEAARDGQKGRGESLQTAAKQQFVVRGGHALVEPERVVLFGEAVELVEEIDVPRAEKAAAEARKRLAQAGDDKVESARLEARLRRALNRIAAAKKP